LAQTDRPANGSNTTVAMKSRQKPMPIGGISPCTQRPMMWFDARMKAAANIRA
jgi:hypothetical protein